MAASEDYYDILECAPHTTQADIHTNYRRLAKHHHPDKTTQSSQWESIRAAYEVLGNEKLRAQYNRWRASKLPISFEKYQSTVQAHAVHWNFSNQRAIQGPKASTEGWWKMRERGNQVDVYERFRNYEI
ncbi:hypothetical protein FBU59_004672 [Linderina macrospora]|uniref:Uncharacterized protein n=1 Tax=Linderina macrospora TaxID=4868 RepID=A0ACC1J524_9FUNG|nr:hypothetical protein FBU59_004672 [Linderina macrospora]